METRSGDVVAQLEGLIRRFFSSTPDPRDILYNEASLQHELGVFLRQHLGPGWRVYFECPGTKFRPAAARLEKKEVDLVLTDRNGETVVALELKCPRNGRVPETMFDACKDLQFLEELVAAGFTCGLFVMHVVDGGFYMGRKRSEIYAHFRAGVPIHGTIPKPTGSRDKSVCIAGAYTPQWVAGPAGDRYWVQPVSHGGYPAVRC